MFLIRIQALNNTLHVISISIGLHDGECEFAGPGACIGDNMINQSINTILMASISLRNESCKCWQGFSWTKITLWVLLQRRCPFLETSTSAHCCIRWPRLTNMHIFRLFQLGLPLSLESKLPISGLYRHYTTNPPPPSLWPSWFLWPEEPYQDHFWVFARMQVVLRLEGFFMDWPFMAEEYFNW